MIHYCGHKPVNPNPGDAYFDQQSGNTMVWQGQCWFQLNAVPPQNPIKDFAAMYGNARVLGWAQEMQGIEAAAEENELVQVLLQRLRTAVKLVRE
jgi:hypothetical protein